VKKNFAEFRLAEQKVIPFPAPIEHLQGGGGKSRLQVQSLGLSCKRAVDVVFSLCVLIFGFPFYLLIAALIKLTSEGPVLFVQDRVGKDERPFRFYKFRTMTVGNNDKSHRDFAKNFINGQSNCAVMDDSGARLFKMATDPRVTSIGKFLRRTSLDELPQFINVLKGDMTLVGPRPPVVYELPYYQEWHKRRLTVKPGLTGLWQVSGRSTVPFDEMVKLDIHYIENWSFLLDLKIILRTIPVMLFGLGGY
jgi:lipopolysaccharide/colanic/teichoic acid biosynthesis glycosyltransferase